MILLWLWLNQSRYKWVQLYNDYLYIQTSSSFLLIWPRRPTIRRVTSLFLTMTARMRPDGMDSKSSVSTHYYTILKAFRENVPELLSGAVVRWLYVPEMRHEGHWPLFENWSCVTGASSSKRNLQVKIDVVLWTRWEQTPGCYATSADGTRGQSCTESLLREWWLILNINTNHILKFCVDGLLGPGWHPLLLSHAEYK